MCSAADRKGEGLRRRLGKEDLDAPTVVADGEARQRGRLVVELREEQLAVVPERSPVARAVETTGAGIGLQEAPRWVHAPETAISSPAC